MAAAPDGDPDGGGELRTSAARQKSGQEFRLPVRCPTAGGSNRESGRVNPARLPPRCGGWTKRRAASGTSFLLLSGGRRAPPLRLRRTPPGFACANP